MNPQRVWLLLFLFCEDCTIIISGNPEDVKGATAQFTHNATLTPGKYARQICPANMPGKYARQS
jgi:hypothetical protein